MTRGNDSGNNIQKCSKKGISENEVKAGSCSGPTNRLRARIAYRSMDEHHIYGTSLAPNIEVASLALARTGQRLLRKVRGRFFSRSRSILVSTNSFFNLASSISMSVCGLRVLPISQSLPSPCTFTQCLNVDGGIDSRRTASGNDMPPSKTIFTASSRNSFVYLPCGIPFILTPPAFYSIRLWCPLFPSYIICLCLSCSVRQGRLFLA